MAWEDKKIEKPKGYRHVDVIVDGIKIATYSISTTNVNITHHQNNIDQLRETLKNECQSL